MPPRPATPRIVKPRRTGHVHRPIIAVDTDSGHATYEGHGELLTLDELVQALPTLPSSIVITSDSARLLYYLDERYCHMPQWQYRLTPLKRPVYKPNGQVTTWRVGTTLVNFFGWQRTQHRGVNHYHYPVDPHTFCRAGINDLLPKDSSRLHRLLTWGQDLRAWCAEEDLGVTPTAGGLAAQLLKDPRWWPQGRRKVPRATNDRVRPRLPGNYYELRAPEGQEQHAYYLDMAASHHNIATELDFPHPDSLTAQGYFDVPDAPDVTVIGEHPWVRAGTRPHDRLTQEAHGLLYVKLDSPLHLPGVWYPPYMKSNQSRMAWVYTNELPLIRELGGRIDWIGAAWTSFQRDPGLNQYARHALAQLATADVDRRRWLKPTLLSVYGILAARPQTQEFAYRKAEKGQDRAYPAGSGLLRAKALVRDRELEGALVNVMYRGMIEAEQRVRTLRLANELSRARHNVLAVYADSLFVGVERPLPFLPPGWRVEAELTGLYFNSPTHFTSRQLTKLPGIPRDTLERIQRIERIRHPRPTVGLPRFQMPEGIEIELLAEAAIKGLRAP